MKIYRAPIQVLLFLLLCSTGQLASQPATTLLKVIVAPDRSDWLYKPNEPVKFSISVLKDGNPLKNVTIKYQVGPEKMEPMKKDSLVLDKGTMALPTYTLKGPGFLQCIATAFYEGKEYRGLGTAGFDHC